jgi:hypothetical protein
MKPVPILPVHPTQLYELAYSLLGVIIAFGLIYTLGRLINLHFRVKPPTLDAPAWFYPLLYLLAMALMILFLCGEFIKETLLECHKKQITPSVSLSDLLVDKEGVLRLSANFRRGCILPLRGRNCFRHRIGILPLADIHLGG